MDTTIPNNPKPGTEQETVKVFFGTTLGQYYLTIKSAGLDFKGEGYVSLKKGGLSFFNDRMENIYTLPAEKIITAVAGGKYQDDISMTGSDDVYINAEK